MFCPNCGYDCKDANFCPNCGTALKESVTASASVSEQTIPPLKEPYYQEINGQRVDLHKLIRTYGLGIRKAGAYGMLQSQFRLTRQQAADLLDPLYEVHAGEKISFADSMKAQTELQNELKQEKKEHAQQENATYRPEEFVKICLNCGDQLFPAAKRCPTCGNKKDFSILSKGDSDAIHKLQAKVPHPKEELTAKWKSSATIKLSTDQAQKNIKKQQIKECRAKGIVCCPKCGSTSVTAQKKGFSFAKGAIGATVGLEVGILAGGIGADKVILACMNCGHQWKPGKK